MRKLAYETPKLHVALTENEIRTMDTLGSFEAIGTEPGGNGGAIGGEEITESDD